MAYEIVFAPEAVVDLDNLLARKRAETLDAIERHLRHEPAKPSRNKIKRLRGLSRPKYRLRVGDDVRVFYDVDNAATETDGTVEILAIVSKSNANEWLDEYGESDEEDSTI
jgi:mRNA-degrading endonuclease RelE of RelBE toxin-antitoxin system